MEKKMWSRPEVSVMRFAANEYVSSCDGLFTTMYRYLCNLGVLNTRFVFDANNDGILNYTVSGVYTHPEQCARDNLEQGILVNGDYITGDPVDVAGFINGIKSGNYKNDQFFYSEYNVAEKYTHSHEVHTIESPYQFETFKGWYGIGDTNQWGEIDIFYDSQTNNLHFFSPAVGGTGVTTYEAPNRS